MMTLSELKTALDGTGLPVAYQAFPEDIAPPLPFITYQITSTSNFSADGAVLQKLSNVQIDLFSKQKDLISEAKIEEALSEAFWDALQIPVEEEKLYRYTYTTQILGG